MKMSEKLVRNWSLELFAIEKVNGLQREILKTLAPTRTLSAALSQAYETLPDEQRMAFILVGRFLLSRAPYPIDKERLSYRN